MWILKTLPYVRKQEKYEFYAQKEALDYWESLSEYKRQSMVLNYQPWR